MIVLNYFGTRSFLVCCENYRYSDVSKAKALLVSLQTNFGVFGSKFNNSILNKSLLNSSVFLGGTK